MAISKVPGLQAHLLLHLAFACVLGMEPELQACAVDTLQTKPSPQHPKAFSYTALIKPSQIRF